jgi:hypothetical protein
MHTCAVLGLLPILNPGLPPVSWYLLSCVLRKGQLNRHLGLAEVEIYRERERVAGVPLNQGNLNQASAEFFLNGVRNVPAHQCSRGMARRCSVHVCTKRRR